MNSYIAVALFLQRTDRLMAAILTVYSIMIEQQAHLVEKIIQSEYSKSADEK
jgi:hypothetical protein